MSLVRVHNFSISLDGFGTGEGQSHDAHSVTPEIGCAGTVAWTTTPEVDAVSATVLDTSMSPRSKRPPAEEAR